MLEEQTATERPDYASMTLEELAASASVNACLSEEAEANAETLRFESVWRGMDAGDALLIIQQRIAPSPWGEWVDANFPASRKRVRQWMRLAEHRGEVERWIAEGGTGDKHGVAAALSAISHRPHRKSGFERFDPVVKQEAARLRRQGTPWREVAEILGTSQNTVRYWVDPDFRRRQIDSQKRYQRRMQRARKALDEQQEREEKAKLAASPSDVGKAYSLVRQLTSALSQAQIAVESPEVRRHLREAEQLALKAEESIWRANQEMQTDV